MFPWEKNYEKINLYSQYPDEFANVTRAMLMHLDKKTYFLKSADEVLLWTSETLKKVKHDLHNNLGNNILLSSDIKNLSSQFTIDELMNLLLVPGDLRELTKHNIKEFDIGGYK